MHGLVHIHRGQRRHIKTGQPHIDNNGNLHRVIVILELACQFLLMGLRPDDFFPVFRVVVSAGHYDTDLFFPARTDFQNAPVDLHGNRSGVSNNHRLAG